jgi:peptidoglycan/LPS O-acetylase OafA/YrhL
MPSFAGGKKMEFIDVLAILGYILRLLGALVFGLAAGWLVLQSLKPETFQWQLAIATILGLLGTFALIGHWVEGGGTLGAFGLGAGAAVILWGVANVGKGSDEESKGPGTRRR